MQQQTSAPNTNSTAAQLQVPLGGPEQWPADSSSYELLGKVGQGAFAKVWRARCAANGGKLCAVKVLDLEHVDTNFVDIRLEVQTMRLSSHPNVLACHTSFTKDTNLWLVTQLMNKGSSLNCIQSARIKVGAVAGIVTDRMAFTGDGDAVGLAERKNISFEQHITYILHETILGLKYIHDNGQIHRDIKAGNILLDSDGNVRIADFGVSGWLVNGGSQKENTRTFVGTPCWMAPEVMEQIHGYDYKADIWSLGITALELAKGYAPYAKYPPMKVLLLTIQEDPPSLETYQDEEDTVNWSNSFSDMIQTCLQKDPQKRPNCQELLSHKHFKALSDPAVRDAYRMQIKEEICDMIDDVGMGSQKNRGRDLKTLPDRPSGTTWIFSEGSQISKSQHDGEDDDEQDFFDQFEQSTQGENFVHPEVEARKEEALKQEEKDDLNDFMDQFERETGGEDFQRNAS